MIQLDNLGAFSKEKLKRVGKLWCSLFSKSLLYWLMLLTALPTVKTFPFLYFFWWLSYSLSIIHTAFSGYGDCENWGINPYAGGS